VKLRLIVNIPIACTGDCILVELVYIPSALRNCAWLNYLKTQLHTNIIGRQIIFYNSVDSTQDLAVSLAEESSNTEGTVIIAEQQKEGKGRTGKKWLSPSGGLWLSLILRPKIHTNRAALLLFIASNSVRYAIKKEIGIESRSKWPNDVVIGRKKVCGILLSIGSDGGTIKHAVIGLGINTNTDRNSLVSQLRNSPDFYGITSLKDENSRKRIKSGRFLKVLFENIEFQYDQLGIGDPTFILEEWKKSCETLNSKIMVRHNSEVFHGLAIDVDIDGSLLVRTSTGGIQRVHSSDAMVRNTS
jgi:BirA family biotin operon repressor/biotin-[acetyl-CoA-carboxylase] ligase